MLRLENHVKYLTIATCDRPRLESICEDLGAAAAKLGVDAKELETEAAKLEVEVPSKIALITSASSPNSYEVMNFC